MSMAGRDKFNVTIGDEKKDQVIGSARETKD